MKNTIFASIIGIILSILLFLFGAYCIYWYALYFGFSTEKEIDPRELLVLTQDGIEYFVLPIIFLLVTLVVTVLGKGKNTSYAVLFSLFPISLFVILGFTVNFRPLSFVFFVIDVFIAIVVFNLVSRKVRNWCSA